MTSENLVIRPYEPGDEAGILELFNAVFAEDDPGHVPRTEAHWRWQFLENPAGNQVVLGVEPGGRVVSQYACLPARVHLRGEDVCAGQGIDSVVHPDYRRGLKRDGAFLRTARYYFEHFGVPARNAYGYGFPNRKAFRIGVRMLGYTPVFSPLETTARNLFAAPDDDEVARDATPSGEVVELEGFDARVDRLWERLRPSLPMTIARTSAYLDWRYARCPSAEYTTFALAEGDDLRALCVLRENWTGPPIVGVSEWLVAGDDAPAAARLMHHVTGWARARGQQRVEVWLPPEGPHRGALLARGFLSEPSPFHLCIVIYEPSLALDWVRANWFFTIGDADVF